MVREIEFEFREDGSTGAGEFLAAGNITHTVRDLINRGDIQEAAKLFASCTENVGDELMADILAGGSQSATEAMAEMFFAARDYHRAAMCAEKCGNFAQAAKFYEADYQLEIAAGFYQKDGQHLKAAECFERDLKYMEAGNLYYQCKEWLRAAESWEHAGSYLNAGKLYLKMSRWDKAVEVLQKIEVMGEGFSSAAGLLGQVYERSGQNEQAARHYLNVVKHQKLDAQTVEVYYRLGQYFENSGHSENARKLFGAIFDFNPNFKDVPQKINAASTPTHLLGQGAAPAALTPAAIVKENNDVPALLDLSENADVPAKASHMVGIDPDFEFLRQLELFGELSLEELKLIQTEVERVQFQQGNPLIVQGQPGEALFIVIRGTVTVTKNQADGKSITLVDLGPGAHVGEMSLMDDSKTSANVIAKDNVTAYKIGRKRFSELLATHDRIALRFYRAFASDMTQRLRETTAKIQG